VWWCAGPQGRCEGVGRGCPCRPADQIWPILRPLTWCGNPSRHDLLPPRVGADSCPPTSPSLIELVVVRQADASGRSTNPDETKLWRRSSISSTTSSLGCCPSIAVWFLRSLRPAGLQPAGWRRQGWEEEQGVGEKAWGGRRTAGWRGGDWGREKALIGGGLARWFCLSLQSRCDPPKTYPSEWRVDLDERGPSMQLQAVRAALLHGFI
jgi:hypothetical protein